MGNVEFPGVPELYLCTYLARLVLCSVLILLGVLSGGFRILTCVYVVLLIASGTCVS